jgi:hypothetical protein
MKKIVTVACLTIFKNAIIKNKESIVVKFTILLILLLASIFTYAQADWERKQDKANQDKRDNFQMQVDLDNRHPNKGSNVGSTTSDNYSWADYSNIKRQNAAGARNDARIAAFDAKIDLMEKCIKQKNLTKKKENYDAIFKCATDAGLDNYTAGRLFGFNATEYQTRLDSKTSEDDIEKKNAAIKKEKKETYILNRDNEEKKNNLERDKKLEEAAKAAVEKALDFPLDGTPKYYFEGANGDKNYVWKTKKGEEKIIRKYENGNVLESTLRNIYIQLPYNGQFLNFRFSGNGTITWKNGAEYLGEFKNFIMEGRGSYTFSDKSATYTGDFAQDNFNGFGYIKWNNGNSCEGEFKDGFLNGEGRMTKANGFYKKGTFIKDKDDVIKYFNASNKEVTEYEYLAIPKSGYAKVEYDNGCIYEGNFKRSKQNGQGSKQWSKINRYVGEFEDNKMSGTGTYYFADGAIYSGDFKDDKFNGQGTMKYADDYIYTGKWKDDIRNGKGILTRKDGFYIKGIFKDKIYSDEKYYNNKNEEITLNEYNGIPKSGNGKINFGGDIYDGNLENGKPNGKGVYTFVNGNVYEGDFVDGMFDGKGTKKWKNGSSYTGDFKKDKMNGKGIYKFANGTTYDGSFVDDQFEGQGIKKFVNGVTYEGQFKKDEFSGIGVYKWGNGNTYKGEFKNDMFNGKGTIIKLNGYYKKGEYKDDEGSNLKYYNPSGKEIMEEEYDKN